MRASLGKRAAITEWMVEKKKYIYEEGEPRNTAASRLASGYLIQYKPRYIFDEWKFSDLKESVETMSKIIKTVSSGGFLRVLLNVQCLMKVALALVLRETTNQKSHHQHHPSMTAGSQLRRPSSAHDDVVKEEKDGWWHNCGPRGVKNKRWPNVYSNPMCVWRQMAAKEKPGRLTTIDHVHHHGSRYLRVQRSESHPTGWKQARVVVG